MDPTPITAVARDGDAGADSDAPVPWWSFGKTVLAAAALVLVAQGGLRLDAPVRTKPFTLRQLLQHRAGLAEYGHLPGYRAAVAAGEMPWPVAELRRRVAAEMLVFQPGRGWMYSNVGYLLVRELIEETAAAPLGEALARLVLDPLEIHGIRVALLPADLDATAWGNAGGYHPGWVYHGLLVGPPAGAALLLHRLLGGHLLPPDLLAAMRLPHPVGGPAPGRPWQTAGYGLGLMVGEGAPPGRYVGHTGGGPGSTAAVYQRAENPGCTAAAFAALEAPGTVERRAMALAAAG